MKRKILSSKQNISEIKSWALMKIMRGRETKIKIKITLIFFFHFCVLLPKLCSLTIFQGWEEEACLSFASFKPQGIKLNLLLEIMTNSSDNC